MKFSICGCPCGSTPFIETQALTDTARQNLLCLLLSKIIWGLLPFDRQLWKFKIIMSGQHTQDTCALLQYTPIVYKYLVWHEILQLDNFHALNYHKVLSLWDSASIKQPLSQCPLKGRSIARIGNTHVENRLD